MLQVQKPQLTNGAGNNNNDDGLSAGNSYLNQRKHSIIISPA